MTAPQIAFIVAAVLLGAAALCFLLGEIAYIMAGKARSYLEAMEYAGGGAFWRRIAVICLIFGLAVAAISLGFILTFSQGGVK